MAEHMGSQFHGVYEAERSTPLPGTAKHPQGRLFAPVGQYAGDPWKLHPDNWMPKVETTTTRGMDTAKMDDQGFMSRVPGEVTTTTSKSAAAHGDTISWHSSDYSQPPRYDDSSNRQIDEYEHSGDDWGNPYYDDEGEENPDYEDFSVDSKDRPMATYGSAVGMHLGDVAAGQARGSREFIHPLRVPNETMAPPPRGNFSTDRPGGSIAAGPMRSNHSILNKETGERTEDTRWNDAAANFAEKATDLVEKGKTLAYRNDYEAAGSTSYRTLPETTRTWSEDVLGSTTPGGRNVPGQFADTEYGFRGTPHPALVHLASLGYNPVQRASDQPVEPPFDDGTDTYKNQRARHAEFQQGQSWRLGKPKPEDAI